MVGYGGVKVEVAVVDDELSLDLVDVGGRGAVFEQMDYSVHL